jgi:hypothetical protein
MVDFLDAHILQEAPAPLDHDGMIVDDEDLHHCML